MKFLSSFSSSVLFIIIYLFVLLWSSIVFLHITQAKEKDSFIFLIEKTNQYLDRNQMLLGSLQYLSQKSDPEYLSEIFSLEQKNKNYIYEQLKFNKTFTPLSQNISFFTDVDRFITTDIWSDLEKSSNREQTTNEYIALGEVLLSSVESQSFSFSAQQKGLKDIISQQKKKSSGLIKEYKKSLYGWDSEKIERVHSQIITEKALLIENELEFEKMKAYLKRLSTSHKKLQQRVTGAQENKEALIKNVKVKGASGKFIDVIE